MKADGEDAMRISKQLSALLVAFLVSLLLAVGGCTDGGFSLSSVTGTTDPSSGSTISADSPITIRFNDSIDPATVLVYGDMAAESDGGNWSSSAVSNDTLTIAPRTTWSPGENRTLQVEGRNIHGEVFRAIRLVYSITPAMPSVTGTAEPPSGSTITPDARIRILFSDSVDASSVQLSGDMASESDGGTWTSTNIASDTLAIAPTTEWSVGDDRMLLIEGRDIAGNAIQSLALTYHVTTPTPPVWHKAHPGPRDGDLSAITWSGTQYVAVGENGEIHTSPDAVNWKQQISGAQNWLYDVTWAGTQFVTVGDDGVILSSRNGLDWTSRISGTIRQLHAVTWSGSQLVAVGDLGAILTSPDAAAWAVQASGTNYALYDIAWSGSQYVTLGESGIILTSPDGLAWTPRTSGTTNTLQAITWSGSQYVAVGLGGVILTSADGIDWSEQDSRTVYDLYGVTWSGSQFVVVGSNNTILTSPDGVNWRWHFKPRASDVLWSGSQYVAVGRSGLILRSTNGIDWVTGYTSSVTSSGLNSIVWADSQYVAVGTGAILTSPDGINWTNQLTDLGYSSYTLNGIAWSGSQYVVVGYTTITIDGNRRTVGKVLTSPDGVHWTEQEQDENLSMYFDVAWSGGQYVAVGATIYTSPDGVNWTEQTAPLTAPLSSVVWSGSLFVAVGPPQSYWLSTVVTSPDGVNWTEQLSSRDYFSLDDVMWSGTQFVVVGGWTEPEHGYDSRITFISPDGVNWTEYREYYDDDNVKYRQYGITWTGSEYLAVGGWGLIESSTDALNWTEEISGVNNTLRDVTCSGPLCVAVGGAILYR